MNRQQEIAIVKALGDIIGYGQLMHLASKIWKDKLQEEHGITDGHFVAVSCSSANNLTIYKDALVKLMDVINGDDDGSYFICEEAAPIVDRCQAILDGKATDFSDIN